MSKVWEFLKSHWPAIAAFFMAFWAHFGSTITAYVMAHPKLSQIYAFAAFIVGYYMKSPWQPPSPPAQ